MKIPVPKCVVCGRIGSYQSSGPDYTVFKCIMCNISYSVGGIIPDHIPESQVKLWIKRKNEVIDEQRIKRI